MFSSCFSISGLDDNPVRFGISEDRGPRLEIKIIKIMKNQLFHGYLELSSHISLVSIRKRQVEVREDISDDQENLMEKMIIPSLKAD